MTPARKTTRSPFGKIATKRGKYYAEYSHDLAKHTPGHGFKTRNQAQKWLDTEQDLIAEGRWTPPKQRREEARAQAERDAAQTLTVAQLIDHWLTNAPFRETTRRSHRKRLNLRVLGEVDPLGRNVLQLHGVEPLGDERVVDVDKARIKQWVREMEQAWPHDSPGYSTSYYAKKRLNTAFRWAIDELELIKDNPVSAVSMPAPHNQTKEQAVIADTEAQALITAFPQWLQHSPRLMLFAGLRLGELLELRVKDLDGVNTPGTPITLHVRRNMQDTNRAHGGKEVLINQQPKTPAAIRAITLDLATSEAIREHLTEHGKTSNPEALIVSRKSGAQFTQGNYRDNYFNPAKRTIGRPDITPHSTRRYYGTKLVTFALAGQFSLEDARRLIGHETTEQLMEYMRAQSDYKDRAASAFTALAAKHNT
ncbi:tyrosine-type recombinase/integrase [Corynebacterium qintianiae]|uniref:tyrosine-type recombinase/integrase n=1 Tax=Corynebacterium qintianiae TaxID=2709392 RepID=UPI0013EB1746|nr:tyrosine-type recombinase/integrase [Corynebacterium qintianiae]